MEIKDVVNKTLKLKLKECGFKTKGSDWWKEIDGGYLMIHHKKSIENNGSFGFHSGITIFTVDEIEMVGNVNQLWIGYQMDNVNLRDLVPEYGYFTEGMTNIYFDIDLHNKCPMSGKEYTGDDWIPIVSSILDTYLIPFVCKISSCSEFETYKAELNSKRYSKANGIYAFFSSSMRSGMFEENIPGFVECFRNGTYSLEEAKKNMSLVDRFLELYRDSYRVANEAKIRKFISEVIRLADE